MAAWCGLFLLALAVMTGAADIQSFPEPSPLHRRATELVRKLDLMPAPVRTARPDAELIELGEQNGMEDALQHMLGGGMSKVMANLQALESKLWEESESAKAELESVLAGRRVEMAGLEDQIAADQQERKGVLLAQGQQWEAKKSANFERGMSRTVEQEMERVMVDLRGEKQQAWDGYVARRTKRRQDVMVLHTAVALVCTFDTFKDDDRCKLNKITAAVPMPSVTAVNADKSEQTLKDLAADRQRDTAAWLAQRASDLEDIRSGVRPGDYVFNQEGHQAQESLVSLIQSGTFKPEDIAHQLLTIDASARASGPLQTLLMSVKSGNLEKSSALLDLVIGLIQQTEEEQKQDSTAASSVRAGIEARVTEQDHAQRGEESKQERLAEAMAECELEANRLNRRQFQLLTGIQGKKTQLQRTAKAVRAIRQGYRAKKQIRDEELTNMERLRSLLMVLSGDHDPPSCATTAMNQCSNADQGMCTFATGPNKPTSSAEFCACEWGFYGEACDRRKCPGHVDGQHGYELFEAGTEGACGGPGKGECDTSTGACACSDLTTGTACERFTGCPDSCSGHGECNLITGSCLCSSEYYGDRCEARKCPGPAIGNLENRFQAQDPSACNGHGICQPSGECQCYEHYAGTDCSKHHCLDDCTGKGSCSETTGKCECSAGFSGSTCRYQDCPGDCGGGINGVCDRDSGKCRCNKGYSGPSCHKALTCNHKETDYTDWALFLPGWSKCPHGSMVVGLKTAGCTSINCIDKAVCAQACTGNQPLKVHHCYQANWWDTLNGKGWSMCREPYFLAGLYRNKCDSLYCIEMGLCCSLHGASWAECKHDISFGPEISRRDSLATVAPNHFITGLYRHGTSTDLSDLHQAASCSFMVDKQELAPIDSS